MTMLCHWVSSTFSPFWFLYASVVAIEKVAFFLLLKVFTSGSFPRRPISCTLFLMLFIMVKFKWLKDLFCVSRFVPIDEAKVWGGNKITRSLISYFRL